VGATKEATQAIAHTVERYPLARTEVEPRVFIHATDDYLELAARFVVPVRRARWVKDELTRRVLDRLAVEGIPIASTTQSLTLRKNVPPRTRPPTVAEPDLSD
jgi:small-conductance mechanosensitive channel